MTAETSDPAPALAAPSAALRNRIVKRVATGMGIAEVVLLDVPLDPAAWSKRDEKALDRLEEIIRDR